MELVTREIHNLSLDNTINTRFIQKFSKLNLNHLNLEENDNILMGHVFLQTSILPINNYDKQLYIAISNYFTEKKNNKLYPFSNKLILTSKKILNNPNTYWNKILKDNYSFTKKLIDKVKIYQVHLQDNIVIYLINIPTLTKKIKELKKTNVIHLYSNPNTGLDIDDLYKQVLQLSINSLNNKFYFFYNNIKVVLKERNIIEGIL
jgi:hypothetical protein